MAKFLKRILCASLAFSALVAPSTFLTSAVFAQEKPAAVEKTAEQKEEDFYRQLELFGLVLDRVREEYVDAPDEVELIRSAIQGMLTSLDPHSAYLSPESFADVREDTSGTFGGLGIEVTMEDGLVKVITPYDDSPASRAGVLANDFVIEIDGTQVMGLSLDDAVSKMRGPIGTAIKIKVAREGADQPIELELTRDVISVSAVNTYVENGVPVIRLSRFSAQAYTGIEKAIKTILSENNGEAPKGIILDLRNNPGGLVDQSQFVADAFLSQGTVVLTRGRVASQSSRYDAKPDDLDALIKDVPLIVLINGGSASAAEIVAGALQDQGRATLVGTRSFGKGSVQSIIPLGYDGAMRITTARYYTPSNRSIQAQGIQPDIRILQDVPEEFQGRDEIIGEAGLAGHITSGEEAEEAKVGSSVYVPADRAADNQLQYAIKLILGEEVNEAFPADPKAILTDKNAPAPEELDEAA